MPSLIRRRQLAAVGRHVFDRRAIGRQGRRRQRRQLDVDIAADDSGRAGLTSGLTATSERLSIGSWPGAQGSIAPSFCPIGSMPKKSLAVRSDGSSSVDAKPRPATNRCLACRQARRRPPCRWRAQAPSPDARPGWRALDRQSSPRLDTGEHSSAGWGGRRRRLLHCRRHGGRGLCGRDRHRAGPRDGPRSRRARSRGQCFACPSRDDWQIICPRDDRRSRRPRWCGRRFDLQSGNVGQVIGPRNRRRYGRRRWRGRCFHDLLRSIGLGCPVVVCGTAAAGSAVLDGASRRSPLGAAVPRPSLAAAPSSTGRASRLLLSRRSTVGDGTIHRPAQHPLANRAGDFRSCSDRARRAYSSTVGLDHRAHRPWHLRRRPTGWCRTGRRSGCLSAGSVTGGWRAISAARS